VIFQSKRIMNSAREQMITVQIRPLPSFPRRRESSIREGLRKTFWIPACAGMTAAGASYG